MAAALAPPFRILFVEDQVRHQKVYASAIADATAADVVFAVNGAEALAQLFGGSESRTPQPDLVILDLEIPGMRGEDLLLRIRADHRLRFVPVIILTGLSGRDKQLELLAKGADDFIEKGGPPSVLIARLKAQMRHKMALDRLERMALDRDLFAAGVLQDIGNSKWTIIALCRAAKAALRQGPVGEQPEILDVLAKLSAHGSKLGSYAAEVIQSVRDTQRTPVLVAQDIGKLLTWVVDILAGGGPPTVATSGAPGLDGQARGVLPITWEAKAVPLLPVLADKSFLRLALLNLVQYAQKNYRGPGPLHFVVSQECSEDRSGSLRSRRLITTRIQDNGPGLGTQDPDRIFRPLASHSEDGEGFSLGLTLVAKVMARMGGRVWIERPAPPAATGAFGTVMCLELPEA